MPNKHYIILVPGLNDRVRLMKLLTLGWTQKDTVVFIHAAPWEDESLYEQKLALLLAKIDGFAKKGKVSLVGVSAGGSLVINAYGKRKQKVHRVITICGRLRVRGFPSLRWAAGGRTAFIDSVAHAEKELERLSYEDKKKILTVSPLFDGIVPLSAISIPGAINIKIPVLFHFMGTGGSPIFYKKRILDFIIRTAKD